MKEGILKNFDQIFADDLREKPEKELKGRCTFSSKTRLMLLLSHLTLSFNA